MDGKPKTLVRVVGESMDDDRIRIEVISGDSVIYDVDRETWEQLVQAEPPPPDEEPKYIQQVIDDGDVRCSLSGPWRRYQSQEAYEGDYHYAPRDGDLATARYSFVVKPGDAYDVYLTWVPYAYAGKDITVHIYDGLDATEPRATLAIDQTSTPNGVDLLGTGQTWEHVYTAPITSNRLVVEISNDQSTEGQWMRADAVYVQTVGAPEWAPLTREERLTKLWYDAAEQWGNKQLDVRFPNNTVNPNFALWACGEAYDVPNIFLLLDRVIDHDRHNQYREYAKTMIDQALVPYIVGGNRGWQGWRAYNDGVFRLSTITTDDELRATYELTARNIAYRSAYSDVSRITPDHPYWQTWRDSHAAYIRDFSLGVAAHLRVRHLPPVLTASTYTDEQVTAWRDQYLRNIVHDQLLGHAVPWMIESGRTYTDQQLSDAWDRWSPFMAAHCFRVLAMYYRDDFDDSQNSTIVEMASELCDVMWERAYVVAEDGRYGLWYRPNQDGTLPTTPAPDLSMFMMPMYAWAYRTTGKPDHRERALKLLESGLNWAYFYGVKQFSQSYIWSLDGLIWLDMRADSLGFEPVLTKLPDLPV